MAEVARIEEQLLATKFFVPRAFHSLLPRPQLAAVLEQSLERPLTLVTAPAGFGKTTLVASWLHRFNAAFNDKLQPPALTTHNVAACWLSLEDADDQPQRFWRYLLGALDRCAPGIAGPLLQYVIAHGAPGPDGLTALINGLLAVDDTVLLVLDDYHVITQTQIHAGLTFLLEHLPPNLHLIVLARAEPPLPLARLRARGRLLELRDDHLRCTLDEIDSFFRDTIGMQLDGDTLARVGARTEGWLVGLRLLGIWLREQSRPNDLVAELNGSHHYILDYLTDEVLQRLPAATQQFLLHTCMLDRLSADLCDAVIGDHESAARQGDRALSVSASQAQLEALARGHVFITGLDTQRRWFRYHPLFAEALRQRVAQLDPVGLRERSLRASRWYAAANLLEEAARYGLLAEAWEHTAEIFEGMHFTSGRGIGLRWNMQPWIKQLPEAIVRARPRLSLAYAQALLIKAAPAAVERWLAIAETEARAGMAQSLASPAADQGDLLGEIIATRAFLSGLRGQWRATLASCEEALALLSPDNRTVRTNIAHARSLAYAAAGDVAAAADAAQTAAALAQQAGEDVPAIVHLALAAEYLIAQGRLADALVLAERALALGTAPHGLRLPTAWLAFLRRATVLYEWNQLDDAEVDLREAEQSTRAQGGIPQFMAHVLRARIMRGRGDLAAAIAALDEAESRLSATSHDLNYAQLVIERVLAWLADGDLAAAGQWLERRRPDGAIPMNDDRTALAQARLLLAEGQPEAALAQLAPAEQRIRGKRRNGDLIVLLIARALAHGALGQLNPAHAALAEALSLAQPARYIRTFVDEGPPLAALLASLRAVYAHTHQPLDYLDTLLAAFPAPAPAPAPAPMPALAAVTSPELVEQLSAREIEVLRLMAEGASNQDIADALTISVNTAKRHVGNILAKLDATNRSQAVARGRALGLC